MLHVIVLYGMLWWTKVAENIVCHPAAMHDMTLSHHVVQTDVVPCRMCVLRCGRSIAAVVMHVLWDCKARCIIVVEIESYRNLILSHLNLPTGILRPLWSEPQA